MARFLEEPYSKIDYFTVAINGHISSIKLLGYLRERHDYNIRTNKKCKWSGSVELRIRISIENSICNNLFLPLALHNNVYQHKVKAQTPRQNCAS